MHRRDLILLTAVAAFLSACGGSGSDSGTSSATGTSGGAIAANGGPASAGGSASLQIRPRHYVALM